LFVVRSIENTDILCGQIVRFFNVNTAGTYSNPATHREGLLTIQKFQISVTYDSEKPLAICVA